MKFYNPEHSSGWRYLKQNNVIKLAALSLFSFSLCGCSTLYFHSNADQKALDDAVTGTNTVKKNQLDAIAKHKLSIKQLIDQQRAVVVREQITLRDEWVANTIQSPKWQSHIDDAINDQYTFLIGQPERVFFLTNDNKKGDLYSFVGESRRHQRQLDNQRSLVAAAAANFVAKGGTITTPCGINGGGLVAISNGSADNELSQFQGLCNLLEKEWSKSVANYGSLPTQPLFIQCVFGDLPSCETKKGVAFDAFSDLYKVDELVATNKKLAAAAKQNLEALEKTYACAVEKENLPGAEEKIRAAAHLIRDFVDALPDTATKLQENLAENPTPAVKSKASDCPGGTTSKTKLSDLLIKIGTDPKSFNALIEGLDTLGVASRESVVAALTAAKSNFEESKLSQLINTVASQKSPSSGTDPVPKEAGVKDISVQVAAGVIDAIGPLNRIAMAKSGGLPDTRAILVDLAMARYRQSLAKIESDRLKNSRELLQIRADAVLNQLALLDKAIASADNNHREEAIVHLAQSWNAGGIPASAAGVEIRGIQYVNAIDIDEAAVVARYATLEPLLIELQTYGAGGFTSDDIARFLSAAALAGIAVGAN